MFYSHRPFLAAAILTAFSIWGCSGEKSTQGENIASGQSSSSIAGNTSSGAESSSSGTADSLAVSLPAAGFYDSAFVLAVPSAKNGGVIRCTFDGSQPADTTEAMIAPKTISGNTVVRCSEFVGDSAVSKATETYFIGETVSMPVVSISVAPEFYSDYLTAETCQPDPCYSGKFWEDIEFPAHVEYFADGSSSKAKSFEIDAGIGISGGWSRNFIKRSVSITMRKEYQDGRLKYPLFETRPEAKKFKSFMLRNNGSRFVSDYIEDAMATSLLEGTDIDYQRSRQVIVFYNGAYHGIYDMREKLNEHFIETNYGIDSKNVDVIQHTDGAVTVSGGSGDGYLALLNFAAGNDFSGENNAAYTTIGTMMDLGNFADYMAAEFYYHNGDWPNNNVRAWHTSTQPWKFMAFDIDHGFDWMWMAIGFSQTKNMFDWMREGGGETNCKGNSTNALCFHNLFVKVFANPDFKRMFANRAAVLYTTYLNSARVTAATDAMTAKIPVAEMERDMEKFPRDIYWYRNSCGNGFETDGACIKTWAAARDSSIRQDFYDEFGFNGQISVSISTQGRGHVLLDGMKLPGASYTGKFFNGNKMQLTAVSDGGTFSGWEDGTADNPRLVTPAEGSSFYAIFK